MENVAHWTQHSTADFIYSISSTFVAQIEMKMEKEEISQSQIANKLQKSSGRISQLLNNPGNMSIRVMVELARAMGMKVSIVAYEDGDPGNDRGPIDPEVFVKCWERANRPVDLFDVEEEPVSKSKAVEIFYNDLNVQAQVLGSVYGSNPYRTEIEPEPSALKYILYPTERKPPVSEQSYESLCFTNSQQSISVGGKAA